MVTPQDAFNLAKATDDRGSSLDEDGDGDGVSPGQPMQSKPDTSYSITTLTLVPERAPCAIRTRRGDVIEIRYEAAALLPVAGGNNTPREIVYDSSATRGGIEHA